MMIKDKIQIGGLWWKIDFVKDLRFTDDEEKSDVVGDENKDEIIDIYGFCRYQDRTIEINTNFDETTQELTLIHELRHAVYDMLGITHEDDVKITERFIRSQQNYDHQIMLQIIEWQKDLLYKIS